MPELYDDDYPTCARTYCTVRIYGEALDPRRVTGLLGVEPTASQVKGEALATSRGGRAVAPIGGWFLSTERTVASRDARRHLDWLLDRLAGSAAALRGLLTEGCRADVACYWSSSEGHGGPTLSPGQMARLSELGIDLWFDFY